MEMMALRDLRPKLEMDENLSQIALTRKSSAKTIEEKIVKASARQERTWQNTTGKEASDATLKLFLSTLVQETSEYTSVRLPFVRYENMITAIDYQLFMGELFDVVLK